MPAWSWTPSSRRRARIEPERTAGKQIYLRGPALRPRDHRVLGDSARTPATSLAARLHGWTLGTGGGIGLQRHLDSLTKPTDTDIPTGASTSLYRAIAARRSPWASTAGTRWRSDAEYAMSHRSDGPHRLLKRIGKEGAGLTDGYSNRAIVPARTARDAGARSRRCSRLTSTIERQRIHDRRVRSGSCGIRRPLSRARAVLAGRLFALLEARALGADQELAGARSREIRGRAVGDVSRSGRRRYRMCSTAVG